MRKHNNSQENARVAPLFFLLLLLIVPSSYAIFDSKEYYLTSGSGGNTYYNVTNITNITVYNVTNISGGGGNITGNGVQNNVSVWANGSQLIPSPIWTNHTNIGFWNTTPTSFISINPSYVQNPTIDTSEVLGINGIYAVAGNGPVNNYSDASTRATKGGGFIFITGVGGFKTSAFSTSTSFAGEGGDFQVLASPGGNSTSNIAQRTIGGAGGSINMTAGNGGEGLWGTRISGGNGGTVRMVAGNGANSHNNTILSLAGTGGAFNFYSGNGGWASYYVNNTLMQENMHRAGEGASAGGILFTAGNGGWGSRGGAGGGAIFTGGAGGVAYGNDMSAGPGRAGGSFTFTGGTGESLFNYTTTGTFRNAGSGGYIEFAGGIGGSSFVSATGWNYGGSGGNVIFKGGNGNAVNGSGGSIYMVGGNKDGSGTKGNVIIGIVLSDVTTDRGNLAINTYTPVEKLHINGQAATQSYAKFTANTTTGVTATDGLSIGINSQGEAQVRQYESNKNITFWTNNTQMFNITDYQPIVLTDRGTVYNDIVSPITNVASTPQAPTYDETVQSYYFHDDILASQDYVYVSIQLPHSYKEGTNLGCHIHWLPSSSNVGAVNFSIEYVWTNYTATQTATTKISALDTTTGTVLQHRILNFPVITGTGKTISSTFKAKLMRESASTQDTFTGNAYVDFFDCHYEMDTLGSASEYGKWTG